MMIDVLCRENTPLALAQFPEHRMRCNALCADEPGHKRFKSRTVAFPIRWLSRQHLGNRLDLPKRDAYRSIENEPLGERSRHPGVLSRACNVAERDGDLVGNVAEHVWSGQRTSYGQAFWLQIANPGEQLASVRWEEQGLQ